MGNYPPWAQVIMVACAAGIVTVAAIFAYAWRRNRR
jgi:hypothetical protein